MASTEQVRIWYNEIVVNHADRCKPGYEPQCDTSKAVRLAFPREGGGVYNLLIHPKTKEAWQAYVQAMAVFGETVPGAGGTHNCRNIGTSNCPSLHAYCVALDLPPNGRKSAEFQAAVLAIRTKSGVSVFKNLASINDRMHDQIDASPAALASGIDWSTVPQPVPSPDMPLSPEDLAAIRKIVGEEIAIQHQAIAIPDEPNRKAWQTAVNSVWHAKEAVDGTVKKMKDILVEIHGYAKTAADGTDPRLGDP